ncbi:MAG: hypothetical protein PHN42_02205 [Bacilli bacterium]|nr:hypothetical protein [Bacilli bacterium]
MAGPAVHNEFFKDSIKNSILNNNYDKNLIGKNNNIYAQGHDLLLYIQLLLFQKNRNISLIISNYGFQEFVYNYLKTAKENNIINDENVRLYLYGYISHHVLDSYFHPFLMTYCRDYLPSIHGPWLHGTIETIFDSYMIKNRVKEDPKHYKMYKDFEYNEVNNAKFVKNIDEAMIKTYNINGVGKKIEMSFNGMTTYLKTYRYDPISWKETLCKITDPVVRLRAQDFFYNEKWLNELSKYDNASNKEWLNMWALDENKEIKSNDSFWDLYNKAQIATSEIINKIENLIMLSEIDKQTIYDIIPNKSAITGLECGKKLSFIKRK